MGLIYGTMMDLPKEQRWKRRCGRALIIGQAPTRTGDPTKPMVGAGARRICLYGRIHYPTEWVTLFDRANVVDVFPGTREEMHRGALEMSPRLADYRAVVILGRMAADAFGLRDAPWLEWREAHGTLCVSYPHPSGLNRWWNDLRHMGRIRSWTCSFVEWLRDFPSEPTGV